MRVSSETELNLNQQIFQLFNQSLAVRGRRKEKSKKAIKSDSFIGEGTRQRGLVERKVEHPLASLSRIVNHVRVKIIG